jgi:hypothetical protein
MGVLTKYEQNDTIYLPESAVTFIYLDPVHMSRSRDSSVSVVMDYGLYVPLSIPGSIRFFSSPQCSDRL